MPASAECNVQQLFDRRQIGGELMTNLNQWSDVLQASFIRNIDGPLPGRSNPVRISGRSFLDHIVVALLNRSQQRETARRQVAEAVRGPSAIRTFLSTTCFGVAHPRSGKNRMVADVQAGFPTVIRSPSWSRSSSARSRTQRTVVKASSSHGTVSQVNSPTSRLSGPAATCASSSTAR